MHGGLRIQHIDAADHVVEFAEAELRHVLANLFGDEEEKIDDVLRLTLKPLAQDGVLRGNTDRASIQMTFAQHDAAHGDQRRGGEAKFFGAKKSSDDYVASGLQF